MTAKKKPVAVPLEPEHRYRSSITGLFVSAWYAIRHPRTTVRERRKK